MNGDWSYLHLKQIELVIIFIETHRHESFVEVSCELIVFLIKKEWLRVKLRRGRAWSVTLRYHLRRCILVLHHLSLDVHFSLQLLLVGEWLHHLNASPASFVIFILHYQELLLMLVNVYWVCVLHELILHLIRVHVRIVVFRWLQYLMILKSVLRMSWIIKFWMLTSPTNTAD